MHLLNVTEAPIREAALFVSMVGGGLAVVFREGLLSGRDLHQVEVALRAAVDEATTGD